MTMMAEEQIKNTTENKNLPEKSGGCTLCPRKCGADRASGQRGVCGCGKYPVIARAAAHFGEEPCISGTKGSGAIFFSGCPLHCVYCQNIGISRSDSITAPGSGVFGIPADASRIAGIMLRLEASGVHNINFVTPTPHTETIIRAIETARLGGFRLLVVWNCGGYETVETIQMLKGYVSVYLPDFKYSSSYVAEKYSAAPDYPEVAEEAIAEMFRQVGPYAADENGILRRGVLVRHLVLPGEPGNTRGVLDRLARYPKHSILVSLMGQYTPIGSIGEKYPELASPLSAEEYAEAEEYLEALGIEDGYTQQPDASGTGEIPAFDGTGVLG